MNTEFALLAIHQRPFLTLAELKDGYFQHLSVEGLRTKLATGAIPLPMVQMETKNQKSTRGVYVKDLAAYLDKQREDAVNRMERLR